MGSGRCWRYRSDPRISAADRGDRRHAGRMRIGYVRSSRVAVDAVARDPVCVANHRGTAVDNGQARTRLYLVDGDG
jgi:hypothetical protein